MLDLVYVILCLQLDNLIANPINDSSKDHHAKEYVCPPGWIESGVHCYLFMSSKSVNWVKAEQLCAENGGFLAEPKDEEQVNLLTSIAQIEDISQGVDSWWLGLSDLGHEGRWIWQHSLGEVGYTNWEPYSPGVNDIEHNCVIMGEADLFKWSDQQCLIYKAWPLCQRLANSPITTTPAPTTTSTTAPTTTPIDYVELRGGNNQSLGNVFALNANGFFGPVCDDYWGTADAGVVCRQLGFAYDTAVVYRGSYFGDVGEDFAMDSVDCTGEEERLQDCQYAVDEDCRP